MPFPDPDSRNAINSQSKTTLNKISPETQGVFLLVQHKQSKLCCLSVSLKRSALAEIQDKDNS